MSDEIENDGEVSELNLFEEAIKNQNLGNARLDPFGKEDLDPEKAPKGMVAMKAAGNLRVACLNGNVYNFPAGKCIYVQIRDKDTCAGKGAAAFDKDAIAALKKAKADAEDLKNLRTKELKELKAKKDKATPEDIARISELEAALASS